MSRKVSIFLVLVLALAGCRTREVRSAGPPPAVPVSVAPATEQSVPNEIHAVGTVEASATVQIKSQIAGELIAVHFNEGGTVQKGDLLIEIDPRPYQEALRQAQSAVARDRAQLQQAEANLGRDEAQLKNADAISARWGALQKEGVISREQSDQMRTNADALRESVRADRAAMESARASVESDQAAVDRAKLDLSYCEIRSPISGRAGNLLVHAGNLVKANDVALVVVNQIEPIWVSFGVPEQHLADIRKNSAGRKLAVGVSVQDDPSKTARGFLTVIDNAVDSTTGTIRLKATFDNHDRVLWPGQLVNASLALDTLNNATIVPSEAIQAGQRGQFVYVVKADQSVERRDVTLGPTIDNRVIIASGVSPGETVVTDGQLRLFPGAHIRAVPADKLDPGAR